jgi:rare lipoprotein A
MLRKLATALLILTTLSACAKNTGSSTAPAMSYVKVGKPYTVNGRTYYPSQDRNYRQEGMASWYGPGFHGKSTANGERFDKYSLTAAHPTLPMPSLVRVTHLKSGRSAVVRINDRGPFSGGRIIDLSRKAAEEIGMIGEGIARVRVEYMPEETDRMMELVTAGKRPFEIDIEREVLQPVQMARVGGYTASTQHDRRSFWEKLSPISSAEAATPSPQQTHQAAPAGDIASADLSAPKTVKASQLPPLSAPVSKAPASAPVAQTVSASVAKSSVYDVLPPEKVAEKHVEDHPDLAKHTQGYFVRLATFSSRTRAESLSKSFVPYNLIIEPMMIGERELFRTRVGPVATKSDADRLIAKAFDLGLKDAFIVTIKP